MFKVLLKCCGQYSSCFGSVDAEKLADSGLRYLAHTVVVEGKNPYLILGCFSHILLGEFKENHDIKIYLYSMAKYCYGVEFAYLDHEGS